MPFADLRPAAPRLLLAIVHLDDLGALLARPVHLLQSKPKIVLHVTLLREPPLTAATRCELT
jgi:hypothetical protein